jgi:predicted nucleic acid-binding protein
LARAQAGEHRDAKAWLSSICPESSSRASSDIASDNFSFLTAKKEKHTYQLKPSFARHMHHHLLQDGVEEILDVSTNLKIECLHDRQPSIAAEVPALTGQPCNREGFGDI